MSISRPVLYEYFDDTSGVLLRQYRRSGQQGASANVGYNRELFCSNFLERVLPPKLTIRPGEIWDSQGNKSGQLELIILREDAASLEYGGADAYLVEGVFAVIEVKSKLTREKLAEAVTALKRVRNLAPAGGFTGLSRGPVHSRPLCCVFAYEGATWQTLLKEEAQGVVDLICVLSRGILVAKGHRIQWESDAPFQAVNGRAAALGLLYYHLISYSTSFLGLAPRLEPYFEPLAGWRVSGEARE